MFLLFYSFRFLHRSDGGPISKWSAGRKAGTHCHATNDIWCVEHCLYQNFLSESITEVCLQYEVSQSFWLLHSKTKYIPDEKLLEDGRVMSSSLPMLMSDVTF